MNDRHVEKCHTNLLEKIENLCFNKNISSLTLLQMEGLNLVYNNEKENL